MKSYLRILDPLGRISIPKELLKINCIEEEALFYIKAIAEGILLIPADDSCLLCGGIDGLISAGKSCVCQKCFKQIEEAKKTDC